MKFQPDNQNKKMEVLAVEPEIVVAKNQDAGESPAVILEPGKLAVKKSGNIIIGTLNIFASPAKKRWRKHYHPRNKWGFFHLVADIILAVAVVALIIFNIRLIAQPESKLTRQVVMTIASEAKEITSGQNLTFNIDYQNQSATRLKNTKLAVKLPAEFVLTSAFPASLFAAQTNTFDLGEIASGGSGQVKLNGIIFGALGRQSQVDATLSFVPETSGRSQAKFVSQSFSISQSAINLSLKMPEKVSNGGLFEAVIRYQNDSPNDLEKIVIETDLKNHNFEIKSASVPEENGIWTIKRITAGAGGQINISGRFLAEKNVQNITTSARLNLVLKGEKTLQDEKTAETAIVHPDLTLGLKSEKPHINLGENINYILTFQNQGRVDLKDVQVAVRFEPDNLTENRAVLLAKDNFPTLGRIKAGEKGEIKFVIPTKPAIKPVSAEQKNFTLTAQAEANYQLPHEPAITLCALSEKLIQKINTNLALAAFARFYTEEGDQLGFGPVPPTVGEKTRYWIFFNIKNLYNDARDVLATAKLPANVSLTEKTSTTEDSDIAYNPNNRQVSWQVKKVSAPSEFLPPVGAAFEVEIVPTAGQTGQAAPLLTDIQVSATDDFTGEKISQTISDVATNLIADEMENSDGRVVKD